MRIIRVILFITFFLTFSTIKSQELELNLILSKLDNFDHTVETLENSSESNIDINRMNYSFERVKEDSSIQFKLILYVRDYHDLVVTEFDSIVEILERLFIYEDDLLFIGVKKEESYTRNYVSSSGIKVSISRFSRGCLPNYHNVTINVKKEE